MKVSCPNCEKSYAINSEKIPPNVTVAKCKACGHVISLKQRHTVARTPDATISKITCLNCRKTYGVNRNKIPIGANAGWEEKIQNLPGTKDNLQIAMAAAMGSGILAKMTGSLEKIEALALGFRLDEDGPRTLSYVQRFRNGVDGERIYQKLNSGDKHDLNVDGIVLNLIELIQNPRYQQTIEFKENELALEFNWSAADDKAFISELSQATIGQLFRTG